MSQEYVSVVLHVKQTLRRALDVQANKMEGFTIVLFGA